MPFYKHRSTTAILAALLWLMTASAPAYAACNSPAGTAGEIFYDTDNKIIQYCDDTNWIAAGLPGSGSGGCTNPTRDEGEIIYNTDYAVMQFCGGSVWVPMAYPSSSKQLVGHWKLDETSGTTAADSSGNGNDGTLTNGPTWTPGQVGGALTFDGVNDYVDMGDVLDLPGSAISVAAWIYPQSASFADGIVYKAGTAGGNWQIIMGCPGDGGTLAFRIHSTVPPDTWQCVITSNALADNAWHHVVATYDNVSTGKLYINGVLVATRTNFSVTRADSSDSFRLGSNPVNSGYFSGGIDDVRVYNYVLSASEIMDLYGQGADTTTNLVGHWGLDESSGTSASDASGNGNTGTLTNFTGTTWTAGQFDGGLRFNNTVGGTTNANYVTAPFAPNLGAFSIAYWFNPVATPSYFNVIIGSGCANRYTVWNGTPDGYLELARQFSGGWMNAISNYGVTHTGWNHIVITTDGTPNDSGTIFYVDGVATPYRVGSSTTGTPLDISGCGISLGGSNTSYTINGDLDDVRIYSRALSPIDVAGLYFLGRSDCTGPNGKAGEIFFNTDNTVLEYCNGASWVSVGKEGVNCTPSFSFTDSTNQNPASVISSNIVQVTVPAACASPTISVSGSGSPEYRICNDNTCSSVLQTWGSTAGAFTNGKYVQVRQTSSGSPLTARTASIAIGDSSTTWSVTTQDFKYVFVTSTTYSGNLGGVAGADTNCANRATAGSLPGTYKAWIASSAADQPSATFAQAAIPYRKKDTNRTQVADNWTDLTDGTLDSAINIDENAASQSAGSNVWTDVLVSGAIKTDANANDCTNWTDGTAGSSGEVANSSSTSATWTNRSTTPTAACNVAKRLYCFQQ